jgi:hypothetical protein
MLSIFHELTYDEAEQWRAAMLRAVDRAAALTGWSAPCDQLYQSARGLLDDMAELHTELCSHRELLRALGQTHDRHISAVDGARVASIWDDTLPPRRGVVMGGTADPDKLWVLWDGTTRLSLEAFDDLRPIGRFK